MLQAVQLRVAESCSDTELLIANVCLFSSMWAHVRVRFLDLYCAAYAIYRPAIVAALTMIADNTECDEERSL